ncbi:OsmC family protein [Bacillus niameyensis]|uniref:OsmC family protein n=1 Tax=Bacillus niameyensis TaxID=1522308 RepID=UPI00078577D9|nr:OsmC family protein [Bacillus niameyensis]
MEFKMKESGFYSEFPYGRLDISSDENFGFRPYHLLTSSIAVCSGGVLEKILRKMRFELEDISINADVERSEEAPQPIRKVKLHFQIKGKNMSEAKVKKAFGLVDKNCSMVQSVKGAIEVEKTYELIEA